MRELVDENEIHPDMMVACRILDESANDTEISLAENEVRAGMHPVDQVSAFRRLTEEGIAREKIAERFGVSTRTVDQRLRLAGLPTEIPRRRTRRQSQARPPARLRGDHRPEAPARRLEPHQGRQLPPRRPVDPRRADPRERARRRGPGALRGRRRLHRGRRPGRGRPVLRRRGRPRHAAGPARGSTSWPPTSSSRSPTT